jgi:hypothetical protein
MVNLFIEFCVRVRRLKTIHKQKELKKFNVRVERVNAFLILYTTREKRTSKLGFVLFMKPLLSVYFIHE